MILAPTLSLSAGSGAAIARPTFSRDFAGERTLNNGTGPAITFTRASNATFFDASGVLQTASNDTPRFDHSGGSSLGLLIEEARTNSIRNSQAGGSTNGVIGSGGVLPTNWGSSLAGGLSREIVATGTVNGRAYIDIRISGTATATTGNSLSFETATGVAALQSQIWTTSAEVALVAGTLTNVGNVGFGFTENDAGGALLASGVVASFTPTATLTRYVGTRTLANASTAFYRPNVRFAAQDTVTAIDFTLRIAAPQLEQGAFATSYIPTTTAAATRAAESAVVTPISFYNQSEGTLFAEAAGIRTIVNVDNASAEERLFLAINASAIPQFFATALNASQASIAIGAATTPVQIVKLAGTAKQDDFQAARDGTLGTADTSAVMPSGITRMQLGQRLTGTRLNGHIRKIAYYPRRLSDQLLQQLTT